MRSWVTCIAVIVAVASVSQAEASVQWINDAKFESAGDVLSGSGQFPTFVAIQHGDTEQGYNTSGRDVPFDENNSLQVTYDVKLADVPVVQLLNEAGDETLNYLEFVLDINEGGAEKFLSVDAIQLYTSPTGSSTTTVLSELGTLRWELDGAILLDENINSGSGKADMRMLVPESLFAGAGEDDFLILYSHFGDYGDSYASTDGPEEWGMNIVEPEGGVPIPEPATIVIWSLLGALGIAYGWRRRQRAA